MYEITTPAFCSNVLWEPLLQQLSDIKEEYGKVHCNKPWCQPPRGPHIDARRRHMINTTRGAPQPHHYITRDPRLLPISEVLGRLCLPGFLSKN